METEIRVNLTTPVRYSTQAGTFENATFVALRAPNSDAFRPAFQIKQAIARAFTSIARNIVADRARLAAAGASPAPAAPTEGAEPDAKQDEARLTGAEMIAALAGSDTDLAAVIDLFRTLAVDHGLVLLDGEVRVKAEVFARISIADLETMAGEYLAGFLAA